MYTTSTANAISRIAVIYPASQLTDIAGRVLSAAYFNRGTATGSIAGTPNFKIYLKEVSATDWGGSAITWSSEIAGATLVFNNDPAPIVGSSDGWKLFPFTSNFFYSGGQNLAVFMEYSNPTASTTINWSYDYTSPCVNTSNNNTTKYSNVTTGVLPATLSSTNYRRPYIGFDTIPAPPCTGTPTAGTSVASSPSVCTGSAFILGLTGNTPGPGLSYQWQSSAALAGPYTNVGSAQVQPSYQATATSTMYYRAAVNCGANINYSTPVQVTVPALFPGGTYTINKNAPTGGSNFNSFAAAINAIACGVSGPIVFNVVSGSGPYNEQVKIPHIGTSSATNTITINGNDNVLSFNATNSSDRATLLFDGADNIRVKRLNIKAIGSTGFGIHFTDDANNNLIDSCTVDVGANTTSSSFAAICVGTSPTSATGSGTGDCDSITISNSTVIGGYYGITSYGNSVTLQHNLKLLNNILRDQYFYRTYNLYLSGGLFEGNELYNTTARTSYSTFYGLYLTTGCVNNRINANKIHDPFPASTTSTSAIYGLYCAADATAGNENVFSNNILYNMKSNGTQYLIYNAGGNYASYYYNTVNSDNAASTAGTTYGFYQTTSATNITLRNNNISITRGGTGTKYCVYFATAATTFSADRNNYYMGSTAGTNGIGYASGTGHTTLTAWQGATGQDANSKSINPAFVAPATGNLKPTDIALDNLGLPVAGITTDILGLPRSSTTPDIGAFEFSVIPCPAPAGLAAGSITATGANLSWNASLNSIGYEYAVTTSATPPTSGTLITGTSYNPTTLNPGTVYYLHLRSKCDPTTFSPWATVSFTTICPAPATPTVTAIGLNGATVNWTAVAGATGYQYFVSTSATPPSSGTATTATTYSPTGLDDGTTYYVHLRTKCQGTIYSGWTTASFTTLPCTAPNVPSITGITYDGANITWTTIPGAASYEYAITFGSTPPTSGTTITTNSYTATGLNGSRTYYVHVRTKCNPTTFSNWVTASFTTLAPPCDMPTPVTISNITTDGGNITWSSIPGATGYEYEISTSSIPPASGTPIPGNTYTATGLNFGTTYFVHVRTQCATGLYSAWTTANFATLFPPCPDPVINVNDITYTSAELDWMATGALDYEYELSTNANPPVNGNITTATTYSATNLQPATQYYLHVRSRCVGSMYSPWITTSFSTPTCTTVTPVVSSISYTTADIAWASSAGSVGYEYLLTTEDTPPIAGTPTNGNSYNATNLQPNTAYYMHIRSLCQTGAYSEWTTVSFNTDACDKPQAPAVSDINYTGAKIAWPKVEGVSGYEYAVTKTGYLPIITTNTGNTSVSISDLLMATDYNFHIRSICMGTYKSEWEVVNFRTKDHPTSVGDVKNGMSIDAYPNPAHGQVTIRVNGVATSNGNLIVTDVAGRVLKTVAIKSHETIIKLDELTAGVYLLKYVDNQSNSQTLRITKQ
jgi:hypothetical protein